MNATKPDFQKLSIVLVALSTLAVTSTAEASGWTVGNGGHVWKCRQGGRVTYELVDHYEARTTHGGTPENIRGDWKVIAREKLETMRAHAPGLTDEMIARIDRFEDDTQFLSGTDVPLPFVNDSYNFISPRGCEMKQLALNRALVKLSTEKTYYIDETIWNRLSDLQKAMTVVHEVLYTDSLTVQSRAADNRDHLNSVGIRALNAELFLDRISELPRLRWVQIVYNEASLRIPYVNHYPSGITGIDPELQDLSDEPLYLGMPVQEPRRIAAQMFGTQVSLVLSPSHSARFLNGGFLFDVASIEVPLSSGAILSLQPFRRINRYGPELRAAAEAYTSVSVGCPSWQTTQSAHEQLARLIANEGGTVCIAEKSRVYHHELTLFLGAISTSHLLPNGRFFAGHPETLLLRCGQGDDFSLCTATETEGRNPISHLGFELSRVTINLRTARIEALSLSLNRLSGLAPWLSSLTGRPHTCALSGSMNNDTQRYFDESGYLRLTIDANGQVEVPDYCQDRTVIIGPNARISPISDTPTPPPSSGRRRRR